MSATDAIAEQPIPGIAAMPADSSLWVSVAVNLLPLGGVLFLDWNLFAVMAMFWLEMALILLAGMAKVFWNGEVTLTGSIAMLLYSPIYLGPAAGAVAGYGVAVIVFFYGPAPIEQWTDFPPLADLERLVIEQWLWVPALALMASHLSRFVRGWVLSGAYRTVGTLRVLLGLYGRVIVLQAATVALAAVVVETGQPVLALAALIGGKMLLDVGVILLQRRRGGFTYRNPFHLRI